MRRTERNQKRLIRKVLADRERDGFLRWTGRWKNGEKVYEVTDAGRAWAHEQLDDESEETS